MGVDGVETELAQVTGENGSVVNNTNGGLGLTEPIKFGSHGTEESIKGEANTNSEANFPKDAVDEWPEPKQIHSFYFIKYRPYDDQTLKAKLDHADKDLQKLNQSRFQITEKLKAKRADRAQVLTQMRSLGVEIKQYNMVMDEKRKEMEPLTQALGKLRGPNNASRDRGFIASSEEELNHYIKSLQYRIQHESIPLSEEKQILREIKQLEGTRDQVIAAAAARAKIQDTLGEKGAIQDQVKLIGGDLDGVSKERQVVKSKIKLLEDEKVAIEKVIDALQDELTIVTEKRDKAFEKIQDLRKKREEGNTSFFQNRTHLIKVRELAAKKDVEALKELSESEADKFIALWGSTKPFRDDYEKRILPSMDQRQLSRDGRMRNPGEKPLVSQEAPPTPEPEVLAKAKAKQPKEEPVPAPQNNSIPTSKAQKEKNSKPQKEIKGTEVEDTEEVYGLEKVEKDPPKKAEVDEGKLKELKREEEVAKAKQALERKKKLAEKAAAKATLKAQKEAEKKLKDREKKAKKKLQASAPALELEEATEAAEEVAEAEKADEHVEAPVPSKIKERKETTIRQRGRTKGPESLSKVILKRKKSTNYWVWAAPVATSVLVLLVIGYNSFL